MRTGKYRTDPPFQEKFQQAKAKKKGGGGGGGPSIGLDNRPGGEKSCQKAFTG